MLEQNERDRSFPFHLLEELRHGNELKDQDLEKLSKALVELDDYRLVSSHRNRHGRQSSR